VNLNDAALRVQGLQTIGAQRRPSLNEAALSLAPPGGRYVVVSRRCTMIYVAAKQFRDIVDREGVVVDDAALSDAVLLYPDDTRICRHVADVQRWNAYKKQSVEELIIDSVNRVTLRNFRCRSVLFSPFPQIDIIGAVVIVWRVRGKTIRSVLFDIVCNNCAQCNAHIYEQT